MKSGKAFTDEEKVVIYNKLINLGSEYIARFVVYYECFSTFIYTKETPSNVYFIRAGEKNNKYHKRHSLRILILGWWGIPWGIIWTVICLWTNFSGGIDVTQDVLRALKFGVNNK